MSPLDLIPPELVQRLGWTLLHSLWQGVAGAVLLWLLLRRAGEHSELRHAAAAAVLALLVILPPLTFALLGQVADIPTAAAAATAKGDVATPAAATSVIHSSRDASATDAFPAAPELPLPGEAALGLLVGLWMVGVALGSVRLTNDLRAVGRLRQASRPAAPALSRTLQRLQRKLRMERGILLGISDAVDSPVAFGWWQPMILFPASLLTGLSPEQTRLLLAHELIHLRRGDYAVSLLQGLAETLYFYQPTVWWASRILRTEREFLCDAAAAELCSDRLTYARALLQLETWRSAPTLACAGSNGDLVQRVRRLVAPGSTASRRGSRLMAPAAVVLCGVLLLMAPLMTRHAGAANVEALDSAASHSASSHSASLDRDTADSPEVADDSTQQEETAPSVSPFSDHSATRAVTPRHPAGTGTSGTSDVPVRRVSRVSEADRQKGRMLPAEGSAPETVDTVGGPLTVDDLVEALRYGDEEARELSAWILGQRSEDRAVVPLLEALSDADAEVRAQAAWALGRTGDPRADLVLLKLMETDPRADVRDKAAWALAQRGNPAVAPGLTKTLRDDTSAQVRRRAAWALGHHPGDGTVSALTEALDDPSAEVRHRAAWALGRVGDSMAVPALLAALEDTSAPVRSWSAWALGHLGDEAVIPTLRDLGDDPSADVRRRADWAAGAIRQRADLARGNPAPGFPARHILTGRVGPAVPDLRSSSTASP